MIFNLLPTDNGVVWFLSISQEKYFSKFFFLCKRRNLSRGHCRGPLLVLTLVGIASDLKGTQMLKLVFENLSTGMSEQEGAHSTYLMCDSNHEIKKIFLGKK